MKSRHSHPVGAPLVGAMRRWWKPNSPIAPASGAPTVLLLCLLATGCMMGQDYQRPSVDVPSAYRNAIPADAAAKAPAPVTRWWEQFNDPVLTETIQIALERNLDLKIATARLREYQAVAVGTLAPAFPNVNGVLNKTRTQQGHGPVSQSFQGYVSIAWEIDFWGRIRRLAEAADADYLGQTQARQAVILSLVSAVAASYIQLREFDARLAIAKATVATRAEAKRLAGLRYKVGFISEMELKQATSEYESTVLSQQQLEQAVAQKENELNLLLGRNPGPIKRGAPIEALLAPAVPAGLPSDLLERRPDLLQAEQVLVAANARVGAAKASFFPSISLTGSSGGVSSQFGTLFDGPNKVWSFTPAVTLPIFSGGSLWAQFTVTEAQREQALAGYQKAIQAAFRDTEDALIGVAKSSEQKATQERLLGEVRRYAHLARMRYENGVTSHLEVLDSQRSLFAAEQAMAQARSAELIARIQLYKALGGDWGVGATAKETEKTKQ